MIFWASSSVSPSFMRSSLLALLMSTAGIFGAFLLAAARCVLLWLAAVDLAAVVVVANAATGSRIANARRTGCEA